MSRYRGKKPHQREWTDEQKDELKLKFEKLELTDEELDEYLAACIDPRFSDL